MGPDNREAIQPDEIIPPERQAQQQYEEQIRQRRAEYDERMKKAKGGLWGRLLSKETIAKSAGMAILDWHSFLTGYTAGDAVALINGALDLIAAHHQVDRDPEERSKLRLKGATNIVAALIPGVPASATTPAINAAIDVDRKDPNPKI